jgi:hypothetical protein
MKKLLISISIVLTSILAHAQTVFPMNEENGKIEYSKVISVPETGQAQLFERANIWMSNAIVSSKAAIEYSNSETGKVLAKPNVDLYDNIGRFKAIGQTNFTIQIDCRDNRYRCTITDLRHKFADSPNSPGDLRKISHKPLAYKKVWVAIKRETNSEILGIIESLEKAMTTKEDDDW